MNRRLLATKFHIPTWRATGISRPRLLERLNAGILENRALTLISAPAGYGKTTLVAEWLHDLAGTRQITWLALDEADNEVERLLCHWLAAFQQIDDSIGEKIEAVLNLPQLPPAGVLLDELLNELTALASPVLLALDDYHVITNPQIHTALEYFINHQPEQLHLVITTRADPPIPLARLRARGQMTEVRASDLRFTREEAQSFFADTMKVQLAPDSAGLLDERTEGWAVGLQLAGLALQRQADPQHFIDTFRGSHRYVLDYLAEEVIRQQDESVRTFLAQTSILERFTAGACEALTGRRDSQALITRLEQANLFIVSLDDDCVWYRYHHLFSDFLRTLLTKAEQAELYKKAAAWHESADWIFEAVHYALASGDTGFAADMIERAVQKNATWSGGNVAMLVSWLDALPPQDLGSRPRLSLVASRVLYLAGRFEQAEKLIAQAEQAFESLPPTAETEEMLAMAALYRGSIASVRGQTQQAIEQITFARARIPAENHLLHARGLFGIGLAYELSNHSELAVEHFLQASDEAEAAGVRFLAIHASCAAAQVQIAHGKLSQARRTCESACRMAEGARIPALGLAQIILGSIALEQNDLASAGPLLQDGVTLAKQGGLIDDSILGASFLVHLLAAQGDVAGAFAAFEEVNAAMQRLGVERITLRAAAVQARLQIFAGQVQAAGQFAASYRAVRGTAQSEYEDLVLARILLATGDLDSIASILLPILQEADEAGRTKTSIEVMLLLALFYQAKKDTKTALDWLGKAMALATPEGFYRVFLDEGRPLLDLLPKARPFAPEFVDILLAMGRTGAVTPAAATPAAASNYGLLDALSEQELRILRLVMAGRSNQEIANELYISVGTAKWHIHNILQKLGVGNRSQAIARAIELGIK